MRHASCRRARLRLSSRALACLVLACLLWLPAVARAEADAAALAVWGVRLGMTVAEFTALHPDIPVLPHTDPQGVATSLQALTKQGFSGGGRFQVNFSRADAGGKVYGITYNRRWHVKNEPLDGLLADYVAQYGPYDSYCAEQLKDHVTWHAYWGVAMPCDRAGQAATRPALYLNLISGKWTEVFLTLRDPALLQANVAAYMRARAAAQ